MLSTRDKVSRSVASVLGRLLTISSAELHQLSKNATARLWKGLTLFSAGIQTNTSQVLSGACCLRSKGINPARTTDDLPVPEFPTKVINFSLLTLCSSFSATCSRPKNSGASSSRK